MRFSLILKFSYRFPKVMVVAKTTFVLFLSGTFCNISSTIYKQQITQEKIATTVEAKARYNTRGCNMRFEAIEYLLVDKERFNVSS
jgi:hypothetical protein